MTLDGGGVTDGVAAAEPVGDFDGGCCTAGDSERNDVGGGGVVADGEVNEGPKKLSKARW